ncbi:MAG: cysteine--tRNA ligase [Endomicrobium sp.]|jgi:cysteinyl-tRNA synthetase|nr:cysteine--tRNA ligase [Endomicrobium sp.]
MTIKIYNTLTNRKEEFKPQKGKLVSMYVCGITPYDNMHLGHARAYVVFDVIKRHLLKRGYEVKHIQNFTDVDDKIIKRSQEQNVCPSVLVQAYIKDYFEQTDRLNILKAEKYPCVTQMIKEIISFILELVSKGFAYEVGGDVYFSVEKFKGYGKLSKRNLEDLKIATRIDVRNDKKRSAFDFVLWKKMKEGEPQDVIWESPWGKGRPGWHIECSVMSSELLDETIDIHGGGQDLIFPHHENEIAQSEARNGKQFVKYWIHNGFVTMNKEKMSKSLNNSFSLKTIFEKYKPRVIRYYLLTQHYSSPLDFSEYEGLENAKNTLGFIDESYTTKLEKLSAKEVIDKDLMILKERFLSSLDDNFDFPRALSYLNRLKDIVSKESSYKDIERLSQLKTLFKDFMEISLGICLPRERNISLDLQSVFQKKYDSNTTLCITGGPIASAKKSIKEITDKDLLILQEENLKNPLFIIVEKFFQLKTLFKDFMETFLDIALPSTRNKLHITSESIVSAKKSIKEITDKDFLSSLDDNFGFPRTLSYLFFYELYYVALKEFFDVIVEKFFQLEDFMEISLGVTLPNAKSALQAIVKSYTKLVYSIKKLIEGVTDRDLLILQEESLLLLLNDNFGFPRKLYYLYKLKNIALKEFFLERLPQLKTLYMDLDLQDLLKEREKKRKDKNWVESDKLRKLIYEMGCKVIDNKDGSSVLVERI